MGSAWVANSRLESDPQAKMSLVQVITTAVQHARGKAASVEYEHSHQGSFYDVEVVNGATMFDVKVNADKGSILSSSEDKRD